MQTEHTRLIYITVIFPRQLCYNSWVIWHKQDDSWPSRMISYELQMYSYPSMTKDLLTNTASTLVIIILTVNGHQVLTTSAGIMIANVVYKQDRKFGVNSLWPSDAEWRQGSRSTLVLVIACCLTAPSHYLNQCLLIITKVPLCLSVGNFAWHITAISH